MPNTNKKSSFEFEFDYIEMLLIKAMVSDPAIHARLGVEDCELCVSINNKLAKTARLSDFNLDELKLINALLSSIDFGLESTLPVLRSSIENRSKKKKAKVNKLHRTKSIYTITINTIG